MNFLSLWFLTRCTTMHVHIRPACHLCICILERNNVIVLKHYPYLINLTHFRDHVGKYVVVICCISMICLEYWTTSLFCGLYFLTCVFLVKINKSISSIHLCTVKMLNNIYVNMLLVQISGLCYVHIIISNQLLSICSIKAPVSYVCFKSLWRPRATRSCSLQPTSCGMLDFEKTEKH